jgi:peptidoglycan hydrolase-like protein with peptidoglycan-binding domain
MRTPGIFSAAVIFSLSTLAYASDARSQLSNASNTPSALQIAQATDAKAAPDQNIEQTQEWLLWTSYYDGPLDGNAGPGTTSAIKQFQQAIGAQATGTLTADQSATLAQRAAIPIKTVGFKTVTDPSTGIRIGLPLGLVIQKTHGRGAASYTSPDDRLIVELRSFQNTQDIKAINDQFKDALNGLTLSYSALRTNWFVLAGSNDSRRFYLRFNSNPGALSGFLIVYDKSVPEPQASALSAAVSMMSLAEQPFASEPDPKQLPALTLSGIATLTALMLSPATSDGRQEAASGVAPPATVAKAATAPAATPRAKDSSSSEGAALAAAKDKIAELEAQLADAKAQKGDDTVPSDGPSEENVEQVMTNTAIAAAVVLFLIATYLVSNLVRGRSYRPQQVLSPAYPNQGISDQTPTVVSSSASEKSPESAVRLPPALSTVVPRRVLSSLIGLGVTLLIGAGIVIAVVLISKAFGL